MKRKNWQGLTDVVFWLSVPLTLAQCWAAVDLGASAEAGEAFGRAVFCGAIGIVAYLLSTPEAGP